MGMGQGAERRTAMSEAQGSQDGRKATEFVGVRIFWTTAEPIPALIWAAHALVRTLVVIGALIAADVTLTGRRRESRAILRCKRRSILFLRSPL